jgi:hypothetical protein
MGVTGEPRREFETLEAPIAMKITPKSDLENVRKNSPQTGEAGGTACPTTDGQDLLEVAQAVLPCTSGFVTTSELRERTHQLFFKT